MVVGSLVHPLVELLDLLFKEFLLYWLEMAKGKVIASEKLVELVNILHVVLLLQSNVDDCLWNVLTNPLQELGFTDDDLELWIKLYNVCGVSICTLHWLENTVLQELNSFVCVFTSP